MRPLVAITGATGYIGERLTLKALQSGYSVLALGRRPVDVVGVTNVAFDIQKPLIPSLPSEIIGLIHLAADIQGGSLDAEREALRCLAAALPKEARLLFVSSQSAAAPTSPYGYGKLELETEVTQLGGVSIRPGLVYGGPKKGLYGKLCNLVRRTRILPRLIWPRPLVQPIHVDDLAECLLTALNAPHKKTYVFAAAGQPIAFDTFLATLAANENGSRSLFLPTPMIALQVLLGFSSKATGNLSASDRLASLAATKRMDTSADLIKSGITLRPFPSIDTILGRSNLDMSEARASRRALLSEGGLMIAYLGRIKPPLSTVRAYARTMEQFKGQSLLKANLWRPFSTLALALLDRSKALGEREQELLRRLDLVLRLVESHPVSATRWLVAPFENRAMAPVFTIGAIGIAVGQEIIVRALRSFLAPAAARILFNNV